MNKIRLEKITYNFMLGHNCINHLWFRAWNPDESELSAYYRTVRAVVEGDISFIEDYYTFRDTVLPKYKYIHMGEGVFARS